MATGYGNTAQAIIAIAMSIQASEYLSRRRPLITKRITYIKKITHSSAITI